MPVGFAARSVGSAIDERRLHGYTGNRNPGSGPDGDDDEGVDQASTLDQKELMLVRIAALVAVDAPPASYLLNLEAAAELGVDLDDVRGVLAAVAPIVGTPRIVHAAGNIYRALGAAYELAELGEYEVTEP
jgi:alkylhydroperoxidase/carboxymuconolactone decarboxylase family protein YurZ